MVGEPSQGICRVGKRPGWHHVFALPYNSSKKSGARKTPEQNPSCPPKNPQTSGGPLREPPPCLAWEFHLASCCRALKRGYLHTLQKLLGHFKRPQKSPGGKFHSYGVLFFDRVLPGHHTLRAQAAGLSWALRAAALRLPPAGAGAPARARWVA